MEVVNHYEEFDELMAYFQEARKYALDHAEFYANLKSDHTVYSTPSSFYYGIHTPSLALSIAYSKSFVKGRKLKAPGNRKEYNSYEYDDNGNLIKISYHGEESNSFCCIFQLNGYEWAVPVYEYNGRYCECYKAEIRKYDDRGRILAFAMLDTAQIWMEKYSYPENDPLTAICEHWNYIPKLSHSAKDKAVSETGSPAQLWIYKLNLQDPAKVVGELIEYYKRDTSAYRQKPPCLPPPQISYKKK